MSEVKEVELSIKIVIKNDYLWSAVEKELKECLGRPLNIMDRDKLVTLIEMGLERNDIFESFITIKQSFTYHVFIVLSY